MAKKELQLYSTFTTEKEKQRVLAEAGVGRVVQRSRANSGGYSFRDVTTDTNARQGFTRSDYDWFRPNERMPQTPEENIAYSMYAYKKVGAIRNIIDLMSDFACQGIRINCKDKKEQNFYRRWFKKIKGSNRSERFLSLFYRAGNVFIRRVTSKISLATLRDMRATGIDNKQEPEEFVAQKREIPSSYTFINPLIIEPVGKNNPVYSLIPTREYLINLPQKASNQFYNSIMTNDDFSEISSFINQLPIEIREGIKNSEKKVKLNPDKLRVFFYKKDDWEFWADPMMTAILDDVILLQKLKLADTAALDGIVSAIRLWKVGNIKEHIVANDAAFNKLSDFLTNNVGGGIIDIMWNDSIELQETSSEAYKFLGTAKYEPVLNSIYAGLGVPPTLTGVSNEGGATNNFIGIKTLIERLKYGRETLTGFWEEELRLVKDAMGFKSNAYVVYDQMSLSDEAQEKALYIQLVDRNIISPETVQERFGEIPEIEAYRLKQNKALQSKHNMPYKLGPYADPEQKLAEIGYQAGYLDGTAVGLPKNKPIPLDTKPTGRPGQGRPPNSIDKTKRKPKSFSPIGASFQDDFFFAKEVQKKLTEEFHPLYLEALGKSNLRQLSEKEFNALESAKFNILMNCTNLLHICPENFPRLIKCEGNSHHIVYINLAENFKNKFNKLTMDDKRELQAIAYATVKQINTQDDEDESGDEE